MRDVASAEIASGEGGRSAARQVWQEDRRFVVAVSVAILAVQLVGSFLLPLLLVPDERHHADLVAVAHQHAAAGWPDGRTRTVDRGVSALSERYRPRLSRESVLPPEDRPPLLFGEPARDGRNNRMVKHPPLYYLLVDGGEGLIDALWPGGFTADEEVLIYRWISALFLVPLPFLSMCAARLLGAGGDVARVAAVVPLLVPGLVLNDGALVHNDALLALLVGTCVVASLEVGRGAGHVASVAGGLTAGLAMFTKLFGIAAIPALVIGHLCALRYRTRAQVARSAAVACVAAFVAGGWFWIRNLLLTGSLYVPLSARSSVDGFEPDWSAWLVEVVRVTWSQFYGGRMVLASGAYGPWLLAGTGVILLGAVVALVSRWRRNRTLGLLGLAALAPLFAMAVVVYGHQFRRYPVIGEVAGVQGRYFYLAIVGLAPLTAIGWRKLSRYPRRLAPAAVLVAGFVTAYSAIVMLDRFWGEAAAGLGDRFDALIAWSPVWPGVPFIVIGTFLAAFAWLLAESVRDGRSVAATIREKPDDQVSEQAGHHDLERHDRQDDRV